MSRTSTTVAAASIVASAVLVASTLLAGGPGADGDPDGRVGGTTPRILPSVTVAPDGAAVAAGLVTTSSCTELGLAMEQLAAEVGAGGLGGPVAFGADDVGGVVARAGVDAEAAESTPGDAAFDGDAGATGVGGDGTNVQVAGVDEPDVVERVGDMTVIGTQGMLRVVTVDAAGVPVGRGELQVGAWSELELLAVGEDRVTAVVRQGSPIPVRGIEEDGTRSTVLPAWDTTSVVLLDLADPDAPVELSRVDLEGWLVDARAVDGVVRLAVRTDGPQVDVSSAELEAERSIDWESASEEEILEFEQRWQREYEALVAEARQQIEPTDWQPHARVVGADGSSEVVPMVDCDRIAFPTSYAGTGMLTLAAIDATGDTLRVDDATAVVAAGEQLYSTADRVVVATTRWEPCCEPVPVPEEEPAPVDPFFEGGDEDAAATAATTALVDPAVAVEPGIVEPDIWWRPGSATDLHVFDVDGTLVSHVASGDVDGTLLNQFAMSIHDGVLRVATTDVDGTTGRTDSSVTTLRVEGTDLVELGSVDGLGPDEDIQSVRFMGEVAYVVTFRRTDPLYVVDLADPAAPRALGELKIEGYSAYLHPLGPGLLLGVGQDADPDTGVTEGVQVSTFDVTDPRTPTRLDVEVTPNSHSEVEWDHHALTVTDDGVVLVPFEQWSGGPAGEVVEGDVVEGDVAGQQRLGVLVYEVATDGTLTEVGVLDHGSRWELRPRRTVELDGVLLTIGEQGVTSWDSTTFEPLGTVVFDEPDFDEPGGRSGGEG